MRVRRFIVVVGLALFFAAKIVAQSPDGTVSGIVLDPSGRAIAGAEITIVNDATRIQYLGKTNDEGIYVVTNLPPGTYRLQVSKVGFKTLIKPDIVVNVEAALAINFTLPIGAMSETVTVEGGAAPVNTESAAVSTVVDRQFVANLPLNGRSFNTLLQLTPGVVIAPSSANSGQPGQFSISGERADANNFTVDGVSANFGVTTYLAQSGLGNAQAFSALGGTSSLVSVEALQEFRVETSSFAPELGRAPGGQVILTTRSGTNDFHGGIYLYFRNTVMDANDWFAKAAGIARAPEHHNDFGGFLGGPIWRERAFFFFSYEGARLDLPQTSSTQVPSEYARSVAPASLAPFLSAYPQPNDRTVTPGIYTAPFTGSFPNRATLNAASIRVEHTFDGRFSMFGRYNYAPSTVIGRGGVGISPSSFSSTQVDTQTLTVGVSTLLTNQVLNTVRGNYSTQSSRQVYALDSYGGATPPASGGLFGGLPAADTYGYFYTFDTSLAITGPSARNQTRQMNFVDDLSIPKGRHELKFGGDYRGIFLDANIEPYSLSLISPSVQSFISTGMVSLGSQVSRGSHILSQSLSLYGQDSWKITTRLRMNYGIRWELSPAPSPRGSTTLASWENVNVPSAIALAPAGTALWKTSFANFAPRFGIAYSFGPNNSFVFRAGGGIFYDLSVGSSAQLAEQFPNTASVSFPAVNVPLTNVTQYIPVVSLQPPYPATAGIEPNLRLPRSYQWNVALEKALGQRQAVSATYVGQAGRDLLRAEAFFQPNSNFSSAFLLTNNSAWSNYDALQIQFRRSLSSGFQALLNYTWSHSLDNASNDVIAGVSNTAISAANDDASSDFDVRQSFSGAITYSLPAAAKSGVLGVLTKDWSIDAVAVARTAFPFNAVAFSTSPVAGFAASRPDRVAAEPIWLLGAQCTATDGPPCAGGQGLNPAAFSLPLTARQGTEGRNDIRGFDLVQVDLSIARAFPITDRVKLQFRADAFNMLNRPNFTNPQGLVEFGSFYLQSQQMLNQGLGGLNPLFQEGGPRSIQLSLRMSF